MTEPVSHEPVSHTESKEEPKTNPLIHVVVPGDTLSDIARHHYGNGDENHWRKIYDANKQVIGDNPNFIKPGERLTIPALPAK